MYQVWVAYLLWFVGGFGTLGLHRFYLRSYFWKIPVGALWLLTGGGFLLGTIHDFLTMERLVRDANLRDKLSVLPNGVSPLVRDGGKKKDSLEKSILRAARDQEGQLTPATAALHGDWSLEQVQKELDRQAKLGVCELRVTKSGSVVYYFQEFDPNWKREFET